MLPGAGAVGFLPTCSLGIAFLIPEPPSDPSRCSRMKTHFDHRDLSLPLDNRNCCFQTMQLPNWIHCPQALLITGHMPSAAHRTYCTAIGLRTFAETPQHAFRRPPDTHTQAHMGAAISLRIHRARAQKHLLASSTCRLWLPLEVNSAD